MTNYGKQLEGELAKAFRRWDQTPFVMRIKDGAQQTGAQGKTTKNPADLIACGMYQNYLLEAKAVKAKSIEFKRVKPHQRGALVRFSWIPGGHHTGYVAVLFYNGLRGKARVYRCFLIEARDWQRTVKLAKRGRLSKKARKSLPLEWLEDGTVPAIEIPWVPGEGWDLESALGDGL